MPQRHQEDTPRCRLVSARRVRPGAASEVMSYNSPSALAHVFSKSTSCKPPARSFFSHMSMVCVGEENTDKPPEALQRGAEIPCIEFLSAARQAAKQLLQFPQNALARLVAAVQGNMWIRNACGMSRDHSSGRSTLWGKLLCHY